MFISIGMPELRGVAGIDTIYINVDHFKRKIKNEMASSAWIEKLIEIDIMTVAIHELGHVKFRQVFLFRFVCFSLV